MKKLAFAIVLVFGCAAFLSAQGTRPVSFPSSVSKAFSPDGSFAVINVDSGREPYHTLYLEDRKTKSRRKLLDYGRHVEVIWNPGSRYFAVTDYAGSNVSECLVLSVTGGEPVNVINQIQQGIKNKKELSLLRDNGHVYCAAVTWKTRTSLRVKASGYGEVSRKGFVRFYTYTLPPEK